MSYILEALQRSEEERARTAPPDVNVRHAPPPTPVKAPMRARILNWIIGTVLAVNAVLLVLWVMKDDASVPRARLTVPPLTDQGTPVTPDSAPLEQMAPPVTTARSAPMRTTPEGSAVTPGGGFASTPARTAAQARTRQNVSATVTTATPEARAARQTPVRSPQMPAAAVRPIAQRPDQTAPAMRPTAPAPELETELEPELERGPEPVPLSAPQSAVAPTSEPIPEPVLLAIRDLPDNVQRRVPPLEFAAHLYAPDPRFREVTINGRRYGEGERVEGMLLSEITPTGVVFRHAGYTFSVSVLEDWDY